MLLRLLRQLRFRVLLLLLLLLVLILVLCCSCTYSAPDAHMDAGRLSRSEMEFVVAEARRSPRSSFASRENCDSKLWLVSGDFCCLIVEQQISRMPNTTNPTRSYLRCPLSGNFALEDARAGNTQVHACGAPQPRAADLRSSRCHPCIHGIPPCPPVSVPLPEPRTRAHDARV